MKCTRLFFSPAFLFSLAVLFMAAVLVFGVFAPAQVYGSHIAGHEVTNTTEGGGDFVTGFHGGNLFLGAGCSGNPFTVVGLLCRILGIVNLLVPVIMALAVLVIIWGIFLYIARGGSPEKRREGAAFILWGIIGLFVMVSIWGLVRILINTFFPVQPIFTPGSIPQLPYFQAQESGS